jgi:hypothetical protein
MCLPPLRHHRHDDKDKKDNASDQEVGILEQREKLGHLLSPEA